MGSRELIQTIIERAAKPGMELEGDDMQVAEPLLCAWSMEDGTTWDGPAGMGSLPSLFATRLVAYAAALSAALASACAPNR